MESAYTALRRTALHCTALSIALRAAIPLQYLPVVSSVTNNGLNYHKQTNEQKTTVNLQSEDCPRR